MIEIEYFMMRNNFYGYVRSREIAWPTYKDRASRRGQRRWKIRICIYMYLLCEAQRQFTRLHVGSEQGRMPPSHSWAGEG